MAKISNRGTAISWEIKQPGTFEFVIDISNIDGNVPDFSSGWTAWWDVDNAAGVSKLAGTVVNGRVVMAPDGNNTQIKVIVSATDVAALDPDDFTDTEHDLCIKDTVNDKIYPYSHGPVCVLSTKAPDPTV